MEDYKVKLQIFEGPLDLLLHLVKINEMDVYDIQIAEVTRQYLEYIRLMQTLDLEVAGEFLVMASTLLNIKLRSLLPDSEEEIEQEEDISDIITARALMEQLIQYRKFKEAAAKLQDREEHQAQIFFRDVALPQIAGTQDDELRMDLEKMLTAFSRVIRFVERKGWHMVTEEEFSVEEKIDSIYNRIQTEKRIDAEELFRECRSKVEMIVVILALLELCRQKTITLNQSDTYGPLHIFERDPLKEESNAEQAENAERGTRNAEQDAEETSAEENEGLEMPSAQIVDMSQIASGDEEPLIDLDSGWSPDSPSSDPLGN